MSAAILREFNGRNERVEPRWRDRHPDFRKLLGEAAWKRLPAAVQLRFAADAHDSAATVYRGRMQVRASLCGRWFAQLCRLIGTPVAPFVGDTVPVHVRVSNCDRGIVWERRYEFPDRAPVTVSSIKQLDDDGTLVEALNAGLHMRLRVYEERGELHFLSTGYFFRAGRIRLALPGWFLPGATHVIHEDRGDGQFRFSMSTEHAWFGEMFFQEGLFQ